MRGVDVARVLRNARDLMNTNGRHWIKGDLKVEISENMLDGLSSLTISPKAQVGDTAFCAWGGIAEVADDLELRVEAMEALVQIIDPEGWDYYLAEEENNRHIYESEKEYTYSDNFTKYYPTFEHYWAEQLENREELLGDRIASWNDADKRSWEDVKASLTKAAERAKARDRKVPA